MGLFKKCCIDCGHPDCVGTFVLPVGAKSYTFATTGNHPVSAAGTATFTRSPDSPCCVNATAMPINQLWDSGFVTSQIAVTDSWHTLHEFCCHPVGTLCKSGEYDNEFRGGASFKARYKIMFCDTAITFCAAKVYVDSVLTCGIQATVTLRLKLANIIASANIAQLHRVGTFYNGYGQWCLNGYCTGTSPEAEETYTDCAGGTTITSLSTVPPPIPSDPALADPDCAGVLCTIVRQVFLPSVLTLPASIIFPSSSETSRTNCTAVIIFDPCDPVGVVVTGAWGTDICGRTVPIQNIGEFCGTHPCNTYVFPNDTITARSRTTSKTQSHPDGTVLFNPFSDNWNLAIA